MAGMEVDELFDAWERAWSGRDPRGFESVCAAGVHYEDPLTPEPLVGTRALAAHAAQAVGGDARRAGELDRRAAVGRDVRVRAVPPARHPHRAARADHADRPRRSTVHAVVYAELEDGLLKRVRAFFDVYAAAMSLGVLPKPGTAGERAMLMLRGFGIRG